MFRSFNTNPVPSKPHGGSLDEARFSRWDPRSQTVVDLFLFGDQAMCTCHVCMGVCSILVPPKNVHMGFRASFVESRSTPCDVWFFQDHPVGVSWHPTLPAVRLPCPGHPDRRG